MLVMLSIAVPLLVNVKYCGALDVLTGVAGNVRLAGDRVAAGTPTPVPTNETVIGLPGSLATIVKVPVRVPTAVGVKKTVMEH
jgi:hypothetical protein